MGNYALGLMGHQSMFSSGDVVWVRRWWVSLAVIALIFFTLFTIYPGASYFGADIAPARSKAPLLSAEAGLVDATHWNFETDGPLLLADGWTVFRGSLINPERFLGRGCSLSSQSIQSEAISLPDLWGPSLTLDPSTGHGVATYCLEIMTGSQDRFSSLQFDSIRSVSAVYALHRDNPRAPEHPSLLYQSGQPTSISHKSVFNPATPVINIPHHADHITLVIQVANYVHKQGGMPAVPVLDVSERLEADYRRNSALPTALFLVLSVVAAVTFVAGRFDDDPFRYYVFAFLSASSALRVFFVSDVVWDYFPTFTFARKLDIEYLSLFLVLSAYYAFVHMLFRRGTFGWFDKCVYGVTGALIFFALFVAPFFPVGTITLTREPIQIIWLVVAVVVAYTLVKSLLTEPDQKKDALFVFIAALSMCFYEVAVGLGFISASMEWSQLLVLLVTLLHVRAFQANFKGVEQERDELNQDLVAANTSLEAQTLELRQALVRAEESALAKSSFLAAMSHELRTPLNAIIGFSELITKQMFGPMKNDRYLEYVHDIGRSGEELLAIVNDILDISRIESGNDTVMDEEVDLQDLTRSIVRLAKAQTKEMDISCQMICSKSLPRLRGDARKIKQLLHHLLSNAIKFNVEKGQVEVRLSYDANCLVLEVTDSGIGMSEENIAKALSAFQQVDSELDRRYEGLGLGLSLVQALAAQHEAVLEVTSEQGVGTCVKVIFPSDRTLLAVQEAV